MHAAPGGAAYRIAHNAADSAGPAVYAGAVYAVAATNNFDWPGLFYVIAMVIPALLKWDMNRQNRKIREMTVEIRDLTIGMHDVKSELVAKEAVTSELIRDYNALARDYLTFKGETRGRSDAR